MICGLNSSSHNSNSGNISSNDIEIQSQKQFINQSLKDERFCNIQALILMCSTGFLWAFFNQYN
jgi:hypothetical protein